MRISNNYNPQTTDDPKELLCEVTKDDKLIGPVEREICHNETRKPWHRSTHVYLFDARGKLFLSKRSLKKDIVGPGGWVASSGGHVCFGETYLETGQKEVEEELGVNVSLKMIGKLPVDCGFEREIIAIFTGVTDKKLEINKEIREIKAFNFEEIVKKFQKGEFDLSGASRDSFEYVIESGSLCHFQEKIF